ncbi:KdsC family phosphatase [Candidatus Pandoraea novymonadis]|uniref:3-deoxy-D-manno-octulosonate 8-phosphate phosphatase KdsC n=1 Tax=Candidatus Pandoraea novymonadis TaxID=1808959 RepID=A0ABX5FDI9_9BURK|nr:HAD hydrolase family protein [Candidatus Pandoraea novymonadis]PSB91780.1 3-deoxy-D-manno-octulosonate 8-phosphate phosphatase KdsC [Candidatus Pandoraea novymonadis]
MIITRDYTEALMRASRLQVMIFDIDGVMTDGGLNYDSNGETMKVFNSLDGHGLKMLTSAGVTLAIITGRQSNIVAKRATDLGITHIYQGIHNKGEAFDDLRMHLGRIPEDVFGHMGDDWPDLEVMKRIGFAVSPLNAHDEVKSRSHYVTRTLGGRGAVREVCDFILRAQKKYDNLLSQILA